jgi:hypothetical protein
MRAAAVIAIAAARDARDAAFRLMMPVPEGSCRAAIWAWRRRWRG